MMPDTRCRLVRVSLCLALSCVSAFGAGYEISKIAMTGDGVPGFTEPEITETFRYFRSVHIFPDGTVAFAGVTTRGQNLLRDIPRGIYYAGAPGSLATVAEMDDGEAWRAIGLPQHILDSNSDKIFAYDYLHSLESGLFEVFALRQLNGEEQALTPTDGSNALVSSLQLGETEFYEGTFDVDVNGLAINEADQVLFSSSFFFKDVQGSKKGLFIASSDAGVRNISFAGDPAPGIDDASFSSFSFIGLADNGTALFSAQMSGDGAPAASNESLWMERDGTFSLVLREGDPAPGIPDFKISLSGSLNILYLDVRNNRTLVVSGVQRPGSPTTQAYWIGSTAGTELAPILQVDSSPNLNDPGIFTQTDQGAVAFTAVDGNSIQLDAVGDVYFDAFGKLADDSNLSGLWKRSIIDGSISLLVPLDFLNGLTGFELLDVNTRGDMLFLAEKNNVPGVWVRQVSGEISNVVNVGDMLESREIIGFPDLSTGGIGQERKTLGHHQFLDLTDDHGNFVFVARFEDSNGDNKQDEGVFFAGLMQDPTDMFVWTGNAGDDDWHKIMNWDDKETGEEATAYPGTGGGTETVEINQADVMVFDSPVHIRAIASSGSLAVHQPLIIEEESRMEELNLNADLTIKGDLTLTGESEFNNGMIKGEGVLVNMSRLEINEAVVDVGLRNESALLITGSNEIENLRMNDATLLNKALILQDRMLLISKESPEAPENGIVNEGTWELQDEAVIAGLGGAELFVNTNRGRLVKRGSGEARIRTDFRSEGQVHVLQGTMLFSGATTWGGSAIGTRLMDIEAGAILRLGDSTVEGFETHSMDADVEVAGGGTLELNAGRIELADQGRLINAGSRILVSSGDTSIAGGEVHNPDGEIAFSSMGFVPMVRLNTVLRNGAGGLISVPAHFSLQLDRVGSSILNEGEFHVTAPQAGLSTLDSFIEAQHGFEVLGSFHNSGFLRLTTGSGETATVIESPFHAELDGVHGTVELENDSFLNVRHPSEDTVRTIGIGTAALVSGEWVVGLDCEVRFGDIGAGAELPGLAIIEIDKGAHVWLEGDPLHVGTPLVGRLGGMPFPADDFINRGALTLRHANFTMVANTFLNRGVVRFSPGRFTMVAVGGDDALFRNEGVVYGNVEFVGGAVINAGSIVPGESPGTVSVEGDFFQESTGELVMELGGSEPGIEYDQLVVNGTANLGGCLRLVSMDGSFPANGTSYMPLVATAISGEFDEVIMEVPSGRQRFDVILGETEVTASAMTLEVATFAAWRSGVFSAEELADDSVSGLNANPDGDEFSNLLEYVFDGNPKVLTQPQVVAGFGRDEDGVPQSVMVDFPWANGLTDVRYELLFSTDLVTWDRLDHQLIGTEDLGVVSRLSLSADLPEGVGTTGFVRLQVSETLEQ